MRTLKLAAYVLTCIVALTTMPRTAIADDLIVTAVGTRQNLPSTPGADVVSSVREAVAALNAGQLAGRVRLVIHEDDCTGRGGEAVAGKIAARGASLVIGHVCSAAATAAAAVYARRGLLFISPGARAPRLTEPRAGPTIFRLAGRDDRFGIETAALIQRDFSGQRVAIVHDKSTQARSLADAVERALGAQGIKPALREAYVNGEKEYNALVSRLAKQEPGALVIPAQPIEARIIFDGLIGGGSGASLIGSDILAVPEIETLAVRAPGRIITMLREQQPAGEAVALRSRAAVEAWAAAIQRSAARDAKAIGQLLQTEAFDTAIGPLRFDSKGDAIIPSYVPHVWRDGTWHPLTITSGR